MPIFTLKFIMNILHSMSIILQELPTYVPNNHLTILIEKNVSL